MSPRQHTKLQISFNKQAYRTGKVQSAVSFISLHEHDIIKARLSGFAEETGLY